MQANPNPRRNPGELRAFAEYVGVDLSDLATDDLLSLLVQADEARRYHLSIVDRWNEHFDALASVIVDTNRLPPGNYIVGQSIVVSHPEQEQIEQHGPFWSVHRHAAEILVHPIDTMEDTDGQD